MNWLCSSVEDSKRSSPSLLARQLRLRLVAGDDSDIPRNLHNIVVSIHAIATFQALHDYLRPRVAGLLSSSRLSGMFAALAASGFVGSSSKPASEDSSKAAKPSDSGAESSAAAAPPAIQRRRSQRLSAKQAGSSSGEPATETNGDNPMLMDASTSAAVNASDASSTLEAVLAPVGPALGNNVIDSGFAADFTDEEDEVDAEVFDDEVDPDTSLSEKTVTVSVVEGLLNILLHLASLLISLLSKMVRKLRRRLQTAPVWQPLMPRQMRVSWPWLEIPCLRDPLMLLH